MKKYEVTLYYHTCITIEVEAENEDAAIIAAELRCGDKEYDAAFLNNAVADGAPDVEEVEE